MVIKIIFYFFLICCFLEQNLFLDADGKLLKIGIFDVVKEIERNSSTDEIKGMEMDIWQTGIVLYTMAALEEPQVEKEFVEVEIPERVTQHYSEKMAHLLRNILTSDKEKFPTIHGIIGDPFILKIIANYVAVGAMTSPGPKEVAANQIDDTYDDEERMRPFMSTVRYWSKLGLVANRSRSKDGLWWVGKSHVTELILHLFQQLVIIVCYDGEIVAIRKSGKEPVEAWRGRVVVGSGNKNPKIMHACIDSFTNRLYFSNLKNNGIWFVSLNDLETNGNQRKPTQAEVFIEPCKETVGYFHGLACDGENSLLFSCDELNCTVRVFSTTNRRCLMKIGANIGSGDAFSPYKVSIYSNNRKHSNVEKIRQLLMAISDRKNSMIHLFRLSIFVSKNEPRIQYEYIEGTNNGAGRSKLVKPQGIFFDRVGNLLIAEQGNWRINGISLNRTIEDNKIEPMPMMKNLTIGTTISSLVAFAENCFDGDHLYVLAGVYGISPLTGLQGIVCHECSIP